MSRSALRSLQWAAWAVLFLGFAAFLLLVIGGPYSGWRYAQGGTISPRAELRVRSGNANLERLGSRETLGDGDVDAEVPEGAAIRLLGAGGSSAFLRFFDERHDPI